MDIAGRLWRAVALLSLWGTEPEVLHGLKIGHLYTYQQWVEL